MVSKPTTQILTHLLVQFTDRRGVDSRLSATQSAIMLQEETIRSKDRERNDLHDRVKALGCSLTTVESEKRQLEVLDKLSLLPHKRRTLFLI